MLTGKLKNKVDAIWQEFYNENMAQTSDIVNQLTILMFIKMLDDKQNALEAQASILGIEPNEEDLTFKYGEYVNYVIRNGHREINFRIPYSEMRWKNFKNLNSDNLSQRIKNYVIPFIKDPENKAVGKFAEYMTKYTYAFDGKERLLTSVVDKLSDDELNFNNTDIMGDVYEYMCGSGISGQYRTPRHIIDMAVEMMKPKIGEKIIDPAMGTAGFLIESAKYIQTHQKDELLNAENKRKFNEETFVGCDNDQTMARIGYMNCILHNVKSPVITMDSLLEYEYVKDLLGKYDLVLQNPPFAGSLNKSTVNSQLLTITDTKKTELLFVSLMLQLMKVGGRGMSIVPTGVIENSNERAYINLRKELINNQKLIGVITMPSGIFMASSKKGSSSKGANIKTAFLIFQKTNAGGTDFVWFYDMKNDGFSLDVNRTPVEGSDIPDIIQRYNHLENEMARGRNEQSFLVPFQEIVDNNYSLSMDTYKSLEKAEIKYRKTESIIDEIGLVREKETILINNITKENINTNIEYSNLSIAECTDYIQPTPYIVSNTNYLLEGIPVLTPGQTFLLGYTDDTEGIYQASKENPIILFDDFTGAIKWVDFPFKVKSSACKIIKPNEYIDIRYLYYLMKHMNYSSDKHKRLWISVYSKFEIPVPSLDNQKKIVSRLDSIYQAIECEKIKSNLYEELLKTRLHTYFD